MREASVGFQCPECVKEGNKSVRTARTVFGARAVNQGKPWVTTTLILLNLAMYAGELQDKVFQLRFALVGDGTMAGANGDILYHTVPFAGPNVHQVGVTNGEWYRLITSNYIHALPTGSTFGITHILFNMLALWQLGPVLEHELGRVRFAALYTFCGLGGSALVYLLAPDALTFGASGAVFGLVGAYFVISRKRSVGFPGGQQMLIYYVVWMVLSMRVTSWQGHLGGLITGVALGAVLAYAPRVNQALLQSVGFVAVAAVLTAAVAVQYSKQKADLPAPAQYGQSLGQALSARAPGPPA
jgi:membrane associated rhomboid family serine protease